MIGLKPTSKIEVMNGNLKCSFREFKIYEGSKKQKYQKSQSKLRAFSNEISLPFNVAIIKASLKPVDFII